MKYFLLIFLLCSVFVGNRSIPESTEIIKRSNSATSTNCTKPLTWRIAYVDPRLGIDQKKITEVMLEVGDLWSTAVAGNLIEQSDSGDVEINLIYSESQRFTRDEQQLSERIAKMKLEYFLMDMNYEQLSGKYHAQFTDYRDMLSQHAENVSEYNRTMSRWSGTGVFPREEKERLQEIKKKIINLESELHNDKTELNAKRTNMEYLSTQLNGYADSTNELVYQYKQQFSIDKTFYQGVYIEPGEKRKINIYQFGNINKLKLVLSHEIGHALGLQHVDNPESIMYHQMEKQDEQNLTLTREDLEAIHEKCRAEMKSQQ